MKTILTITLFALMSQVYAYDAAKEFASKCIACHSIGGGDAGKSGPDLAGLSKRRTVDWIVKFVKYPEGMIHGDDEEAGYEKADLLAKKVFDLYKPAMMADQELDKAQVVALLKYIDAQKKEPKGKILKALK